MYKVKIDGNTIYNSGISSDLAIISPKLELEVNSAGEFEFTMPPTHPYYGRVERLSSVVEVEEDGVKIFEGRATEEHTDFWKRKTYHCEGCLAYLKDTKQPPAEYHDITVRQYLSTLVAIHNAKVTADKQFTVGAVTVTDSNDSLYRYTNWESTLECIYDDMVKSLGGYLRVRFEDGTRYLDYLKEFPNTNSQTIEFGKNLLDYVSSYDTSEYCTVLVPQGAELEESEIPALHLRLGIEEVNSGSPYLVNTQAVQEHGWIERVVTWDGVTVAQNLLTKGQQYMQEVQWDSMVLSISAVDLHKLNPSVENIKLMDEIRAISTPHGMNRIFPVTKVSIPLDSASGTKYTLGTKVTQSLTSTTEAVSQDILEKIKKAKTPQEILESAKDNATALIRSALGGYVVITEDASELLIMDTDDIETARRVWRWNLNGLGYSSTGYNGRYGLAMTMDGAIVADFITTGTLNADLIRAGTLNADLIRAGTMSADRIQGGTLKLGGSNNAFGTITIYDGAGTQMGSINAGGITCQLGVFNGVNLTDIDGSGADGAVLIDSSGMTINASNGSTTLPVTIDKLNSTDINTTNADIDYLEVDGVKASSIELTGDLIWWTSAAKTNYVFARETRSTSPTGYTLKIPDAEIARLSFYPYGTEPGSTKYRPVASYGTDGNRVKYLTAHSQSHTVPYSLGVNAQWGRTGTGTVEDPTYVTKNFAPSSSDIRLKENVKDCEIEALPFIQKIQMRQFDWKQNGVHQDCGFVADELEQLDENLSIGGGYNEDGTMNEKSVNDFYLLGYMVKAMQEMQAEIDYLKGVVKDGINRRVDTED